MTDQAPVNTKFVDIYLSTNNGSTFPILLASQVPNDGSELVTIPNLTGNTNRIMVKGYDNIFFDVSNASFTISSGIPDFTLSFSGIQGAQNKAVCQGETLTFTLPFSTFDGFSNPVTFAVVNLPSGITATFAPAMATTDVDVVMTLTTTTAVQPQLYTINVQATSGAVIKNINVYANIVTNEFSQITLTTPADAAVIPADSGNFSWTASTGATNYQIQIATDANFATIIETATVQTTTYSAAMLENTTVYYWRVQPSNEGCSTNFSSSSSFSTLFCGFTASTNSPIAIPFQVITVTSTLTIGATDSVTISDLNVQLDISHTYVSDLNVRLTSPSGTQVQLFANRCRSNNNVNAVFDDAGIAIVCGQNPAISGTVIPSQSLAAFNGQVSQGTWTLSVSDTFNQDGGTINNWGINICSVPSTLETAKNELSHFIIYPNPNNGSFNIQFKNIVSDKLELHIYDMSGRKFFSRSYSPQGEFNENIQLNALHTGIYLLSVYDGERTQVQRIIIK